MKKKYQFLFRAVALGCFTVAISANAEMSVQVFFSPGVPIDSTNNLLSQQNKMVWLDTGNLVGGAYETNPTAMTLPKVLKIGDLVRFRSSAFPGWLATETASGPDVWGARMFCLGKLTNRVANINPRRIRVRTWATLTDNVLVSTNWLGIDSATGQPITMSSSMTGRRYGIDGARGGSDDAIYNTGSSDVELNELLTVGPRIFLNIANQSDLVSVRNYWNDQRPIELHCEYVAFDTDLVTVIGRTEIVLSACPYLWCDRVIFESMTQSIRLESERPPKIYRLLMSENLNGNWTDVPGGLLQNGGIYTNNITSAKSFFRCGEYVAPASPAIDQSTSRYTQPKGSVENGKEVQ